MLRNNLKYKEDTVKTILDGKEYTIINLTPIYSKEERQKVKEKIESKLLKYSKNMYKPLKQDVYINSSS